MVASLIPLTGDQTYNPGMCPDWESNQQSFVSQATEPRQPGKINTNDFKMLFLIAEMCVVNWYFYVLLRAIKGAENCFRKAILRILKLLISLDGRVILLLGIYANSVA